jgi:O-antigen/teichoic acid export membrane protein
VLNGTLGGLQRFGAVGSVLIGSAVFRLVTAVGLILLGGGVIGAVASLPLANLGAFLLGLLFVVDVLCTRERAGQQQTKGALGYSVHVALVTICYAVLTYSDTIIVKSRFLPTEAGLYSAVATLGRLTLFPSVMATLLMPKATDKHARGRSTIATLRKTLLAVGLLCGTITLVFMAFPTHLVRILFGEQYLANASFLGLYALAMMLYALINVWLIYYLAINDKRYTYVLLAGTVLLVTLLALLPLSFTRVVFVLVGIGVALNLAGELLLHVGRSESPKTAP